MGKSFRSGNDSQAVLKQLAITLKKGETVIILGQSGSGKSTLLNLIAGLDTADEGDIIFQLTNEPPLNICTMNETQRTAFRRRHIGFVFQFFNLIPTLTVVENVRLPLQLNPQISQPINTPSLADELLVNVGLGHCLQKFPEQLSGGEQQRAAICRALVHHPALLLADEPTGSLDNETASEVIRLLFAQARQYNQTLLLATHNHDLIPLADRVLKLQQGSLVEYEETTTTI